MFNGDPLAGRLNDSVVVVWIFLSCKQVLVGSCMRSASGCREMKRTTAGTSEGCSTLECAVVLVPLLVSAIGSNTLSVLQSINVPPSWGKRHVETDSASVAHTISC